MRSVIPKVILLMGVCACTTRPAWSVNPETRISQYSHTAWRTSEGIFESTPTSLAQTSDGYLWVGSSSGLLRFDGVRFVKFMGANGIKLPTNTIFSLLTDHDGSLWIGTAWGLSHLKNGVLTNLKSNIGAVRAIAQDDAGVVWVARANMPRGNGALCKVTGDALQCIGARQGFPIPFAKAITCDHQGNVWVGGATSYIRWSPHSQTVYAPDAFKKNTETAAIGSMALAPDGNPMVAMLDSGPGLGLEEMVGGKPRPYGPFAGIDPERDIEANAIRVDSHGAVWLGTDHGIVRLYHGGFDTFGPTDGLSGRNVNDILEDREGNIWVATTDGLDRLRELAVTSFTEHEGLRGPTAHTVLADRDGAVWVQAGPSLDVLQPGSLAITHGPKFFDGRGYIPLLFQARDGALWLSMNEQLIRMDHGNRQIIAPPPGAPPHTLTYGFAEDANGNIYALQGMTPDLWRIHNGVATRVVTTPALPVPYVMTIDHDGALWFGFPDGRLGHLQGTSLEFISVPHTGINAFIRQISVAPDGAILAAAEGLVVYKDGKVSSLGTAQGLPCDKILSFTFDHDGDLWMPSTCGTMEVSHDDWLRWRRDPGAMVKPRVLDVLDGVRWAAVEMNHAADVTPDGRLWFASGASLQMIDPRNLAVNTVIPAVHIEDVIADGTAAPATDSLSLAPLTRQIQIDYTATSLSLPQRVLFRYKLEGHDKEWQEAGNRRQAFYNDLKPGRYRFIVLACNNSGLWNKTGASITFTVDPAWFQTRWFMLLCITLAVAFLCFFYWLRMKQLRSRFQLLYEARLEERTRVARDLHDTLLQTIQGTKLVAEQALLEDTDPSQLKKAVGRIYEWLAKAVVEGRAALTALRTESVISLVDRLRHIAENCSSTAGMALDFEVSGTVSEFSEDVTEEIFRVGYEAIRNACVHSKGSRLEVRLIYGRPFVLRVRDNGIGIDPEISSGRTFGHYGLPGMHERADKLGATLTIRSAPETGTEVSLEGDVRSSPAGR